MPCGSSFKASFSVLLSVLFLFLFLPFQALSWPGVVLSVHDGDTLRVRNEQGRVINIRLWGVDAPELGQPYGKASRNFLRAGQTRGSHKSTGGEQPPQACRPCLIGFIRRKSSGRTAKKRAGLGI